MWSEFLTKLVMRPMQYFRPGSQLQQLITMLSIVDEYPIHSLYLLGNEQH